MPNLDEVNTKVKILYVEDDEITRENAVEYLKNYFENIYEAQDAFEAFRLYESLQPDIIITDIQMPKMTGLEFVKKIRDKDKKTQVIISTAFSNKEYLMQAIELQLVKYLIKPIKENALLDALALCVNSLENDSSNIISLNENFYFDIYNEALFKDDDLVKLRTKEIQLLKLLIKNKTRYVTYSEIENIVWYDGVMTKDALKTLIKNLKAKLPDGIILNLTGTGYKIEL